MDIVQILRMNTEEKILAKALEMFNERGIEYVGLRELAGILGIRVSNITYYFATKDDLVNRISLELSAANEAVLRAEREPGLHTFLDTMRIIFNNHMRYRCIALSLVHILDQNEVISERFKKTQLARRNFLTTSLSILADGGWVAFPDPADRDALASMIALLARFWIPDSRFTVHKLQPPEQIRYYLHLLVALFNPFLTSKGKKETRKFIDEISGPSDKK